MISFAMWSQTKCIESHVGQQGACWLLHGGQAAVDHTTCVMLAEKCQLHFCLSFLLHVCSSGNNLVRLSNAALRPCACPNPTAQSGSQTHCFSMQMHCDATSVPASCKSCDGMHISCEVASLHQIILHKQSKSSNSDVKYMI